MSTDSWKEFGNNGTIQGACCGPFKQTYGAAPGPHCRQCGVYMYSEVLNALGGSEDGAYHDPETVSDIAYMSEPGKDGYTAQGTWITFSGAKSIKAIIEYANKNELAGAFIWDTSMDTVSPAYTLMNLIADGLGKPKQIDGPPHHESLVVLVSPLLFLSKHHWCSPCAEHHKRRVRASLR